MIEVYKVSNTVYIKADNKLLVIKAVLDEHKDEYEKDSTQDVVKTTEYNDVYSSSVEYLRPFCGGKVDLNKNYLIRYVITPVNSKLYRVDILSE